jgi:hypothetical protein
VKVGEQWGPVLLLPLQNEMLMSNRIFLPLNCVEVEELKSTEFLRKFSLRRTVRSTPAALAARELTPF